MNNKIRNNFGKHMLKVLNKKVKFIDILDIMASVELRRRREEKNMSYLNVYHNILAGIGRFYGIIKTDKEESLILGFFMRTVDLAQEKYEKFKKGKEGITEDE